MSTDPHDERVRPQDAHDEILDALVASYQGPELINNLDTYALPNRRAVIQAFSHIQHLMFLGFFSTRRLEPSSLRLALAEHLMGAQEILTEQIRRAAEWEDRQLPPDEQRHEGWCLEATQQLLREVPEIRRKLYGDIQSAYANDPAAGSIEEIVFSYPGVLAVTAYRVAHVLHRLDVPMIPRIIAAHAHARTGVDIHPAARIGERFFIDHGTGVVIGATSVIGDDVKLYQGVTLGAISVRTDTPRDGRNPAKRHPTLRDGVTVYAGSTILGGDTIVGARSVIGGNVWLTQSVAPDSKIYRKSDTQKK
ncbi:MAG: serine acetyltransferase [Myxococcota bacterium]